LLAAPALLLLTLSTLLTGCSANFNPQLTGADPSLSVGVMKGNIHGGQAPIYQAAIYVMQTGLSGYPLTLNPGPTYVYAPANTSLITSSGSGTFTGTVNGTSHGTYVLTDVNGNFTIPGFTCTPGAGVYIYSVGGEPIYGTPNNAATEMAAMGICPAGGAAALAASVPFVNVNEVSTVAMAYALGGFEETGLDATHISSSSTNTTGLANAFGIAADLYTVSANNGANQTIPGGSGTNSITYQTINTLANILAACINSNGSTASSTTPCYILFQNATSNGATGGGTIPTDTASAIINIVHYPQSNVSNLFALASNSYAPFTPAYSSAPTNFVVGISYQNANLGGNINAQAAAMDSAGYLYYQSGATTSGANIAGLTKFSPYSGIVGTSATTLDSPKVSIDKSNNVFLTLCTQCTTYPFTNSATVNEYAASTTSLLGALTGSYTVTTSGVSSVTDMGIGPFNDLLLQLKPSTGSLYVTNVPYSGSTYNVNSPTYTFNPSGTVDLLPGVETTAGTVYMPDFCSNHYYTTSGSTVTKVNDSTSSDAICLGRNFDLHQSPVFNIPNANAIYLTSGINRVTGGGLSSPQEPIIDGNQMYWMPNANSCAVSIFSLYSSHDSYSSTTWLYSSGLSVPGCSTSNGGGLADGTVSPSGNLWVYVIQPTGATNSTTGNAISNSYMFQMIGVAAPTIQPIALLEAYGPTANYDMRP
jgi:hypothetical protein